MKFRRAILFLLLIVPPALAGDTYQTEPWLQPRSMDRFQSLLQRSPFSLPTAEESAPGADRFFLTGLATIDDRPVVFVFDKNTQNRLMLEKVEDSGNQAKDRLLEVFEAPDPKNLRATVQIEGQRIEIRFSESSFEAASAQAMPVPAGVPGQHIPPQPPQPQPGTAPRQQQATIQPGNNSNSQPPRRVIRRRVISGQQPAAQPIPGQ